MNVEADNQNKMEKADVVGMESEEKDVEKNVIAYEAGLMSAVSSSSSSATGSAEERHYGDDGNFKLMAGEERRSITDKIDKYSEFDRRSAQTIAVEEMAIRNEPTPSVLTKLFRLDGQTGHLQADQAERAEEFEIESEFGYLTDTLLHEMKAKKNSVSTMGATHEKQIEAINIDNIFIPECQPGGLQRGEDETLGIETRDQCED